MNYTNNANNDFKKKLEIPRVGLIHLDHCQSLLAHERLVIVFMYAHFWGESFPQVIRETDSY